MDVQKEILRVKESNLRKYQRLFVGQKGLLALLKFELIIVFAAWVPGAMGILLRKMFYPMLLKDCGKGVTFGTNVVLRHPAKISIGENVVIDDNCVIDAKGNDNRGIQIESNVFIGRNTILYCQNGDICIRESSNIGSNCQVFSAKTVEIGRNVLVGAYAYLIGGGHRYDRNDIPIINQGRVAKGILLKDNIWLGAGAKILDGVTIGESAIIGTGAVVNENIPEFMIAGGVPARIIGDRRNKKASTI